MSASLRGGPDSSVSAAGGLVFDALCCENRAAAARIRACHQLFEVCEAVHFDELFAAGYDPESDDRSDYAVVDPYEVATAEIVAAYGVHLHRARAMLTLALDLVRKFPAIVDAMESGRLDERTATMLANQMRTVDARHRPDVHRAVVDWLLGAIDSGRRPGRNAILAQTDRIIEVHDPEGVLHRRRSALNGRCVQLRRGLDGMAVLHANLSAIDASAIFSALQEAAREQLAEERSARADAASRGEPSEIDFAMERNIDQRRADALVDALLGSGTPLPARGNSAPDPAGSASPSPATGDSIVGAGAEDDTAANGGRGAAAQVRSEGEEKPEGEGTPEGEVEPGLHDASESPSGGALRPAGGSPLSQLRPQITVLAPLGPDGEPEVYLPRGGQASIDALIALLARSIGASISIPDPEPGASDSPPAARRYRISTELARRVRLRDGTCRHPGCSVAAEACDIDHVRPFNHSDPGAGGLTVEANLMCLCRRHHRFKTFHDWGYRLSRDGTLTVTTSTGHTVTTEPSGPLARWRQQRADGASTHHDTAAQPPEDPRPQPHPLDPGPTPTHWLRRTRRLAAERRANSVAEHASPGEDPEDVPPPF